MLPPSLIEFLKESKSKLLSNDDLKRELTLSGWSNSLIDEAVNWYQTYQPVNLNSPTTQATVSSGSSFLNQSTDKRSFNPLIIVVVLLLLFIPTTGVLAYFVASEKIAIPDGKVKDTIQQNIIKVPFIPKTPKMVLFSATKAAENLKKNSIDFSIATTSNSYNDILGTNQLDILFKGYGDVSDVKNPRFSFSGSITKEMSFEMRKADAKKMYLKVNKVPLALVAALRLNPDDVNSLLANWIQIDTENMETEARKNLEGVDVPKSESETKLNQEMQTFFEEKVLPQMTLKNDELDGKNVYVIRWEPTPGLIDELFDKIEKTTQKGKSPYVATTEEKVKPSDVIGSPVVNLYIDTKSNYLTKLTTSFIIDPSKAPSSSPSVSMPSVQEPIAVSMVLKITDQDQDVPIEIPSSSLTPEEFYKKFLEKMPSASGMMPPTTLSTQ